MEMRTESERRRKPCGVFSPWAKSVKGAQVFLVQTSLITGIFAIEWSQSGPSPGLMCFPELNLNHPVTRVPEAAEPLEHWPDLTFRNNECMQMAATVKSWPLFRLDCRINTWLRKMHFSARRGKVTQWPSITVYSLIVRMCWQAYVLVT